MCLIERIGKIAPGMRDIGLTLSCEESKHDIVENRQYFRCMTNMKLSVVSLYRSAMKWYHFDLPEGAWITGDKAY